MLCDKPVSMTMIIKYQSLIRFAMTSETDSEALQLDALLTTLPREIQHAAVRLALRVYGYNVGSVTHENQ